MKEENIALIEHTCSKLINRFAYLNDAQRYAELAELFSDDARFARPTDPDNYTLGKDNILAAFMARPKDRISRHAMSNILIDVTSESTAKGVSYVILYTASTDDVAEKFGLQANQSQFIGEFYDDFILTDTGWKIASRSGRIIFTS